MPRYIEINEKNKKREFEAENRGEAINHVLSHNRIYVIRKENEKNWDNIIAKYDEPGKMCVVQVLNQDDEFLDFIKTNAPKLTIDAIIDESFKDETQYYTVHDLVKDLHREGYEAHIIDIPRVKI